MNSSAAPMVNGGYCSLEALRASDRLRRKRGSFRRVFQTADEEDELCLTVCVGFSEDMLQVSAGSIDGNAPRLRNLPQGVPSADRDRDANLGGSEVIL